MKKLLKKAIWRNVRDFKSSELFNGYIVTNCKFKKDVFIHIPKKGNRKGE